MRVWPGFAVGVFGIACAAIFVRTAAPAPPVIVAFYRVAIGSFLLAIFIALRSASDRSLRAQLRPGAAGTGAALLAGAAFATDLALWHTSLFRTSVANSTLLVNTTPLYVGLYTLWVLRIPLARGFVLGGALALGGCALLLGLDTQRSGAIEGDALALAAAGFYSIYLLAMKRARESLSTLAALMFAGLASSVVLGIYALALGEPFFGFPTHSWLAILGAATVSQIGGLFGIAWALRYLPATFASVGLLAQPVGTAILAWIILGEALGTLQLVGGVAVLIGIGVAARDPAAAGPTPADAGPH